MKEKKSFLKTIYEATMSALKSFWRWIKRLFVKEKLPLDGGEALESPSDILRHTFFGQKRTKIALVLLAAIFAFVFIAPVLLPMDVNYTDPLQQNVAPVYSMRSLPKKLKKDVREINGFSDFTVGLSGNGNVYVWGNTKYALQGFDLKDIPKSVKEEKGAFVAAGKDHILCLTQTGTLVGWGDKSCGQYGTEEILNAVSMPKEIENGVEPSQVKQLVCGYQASGLVKTDGSAYLWGNMNAVRNLLELSLLSNVEKVVFTNSAAVALFFNGQIGVGKEAVFTSAVSSKKGRISELNAYLVGRNVQEIAASNKCIALVLEDGELLVSGVFENGEDELPVLEEGEYFISLSGGTRHFAGVTNRKKAYAWGHNAYKQCSVNGERAERVFTGSLQTYTVDGQNKLVKSVGLRGYLMGTDGRGRDVFTRIAHGGKMTMTIGGVAVLVSSVIAILIGCISGYFGGAVDTLLMRITEIFASMPFLPFAMLLSQIIKNYSISENMRIFIIMLILGALSWTGLARMIRGQVLSEREKEFVTAARAMGVKESKIAFRHVLPNVISVILVSMTLNFASCLLTESSLSYLGFGVQQPQPTWGNMLHGCNNSTVIQNYWWQWVFPSLFLSLAVICINVIGDALRDALDPKNAER